MCVYSLSAGHRILAHKKPLWQDLEVHKMDHMVVGGNSWHRHGDHIALPFHTVCYTLCPLTRKEYCEGQHAHRCTP